jgi:plasmid stability protein
MAKKMISLEISDELREALRVEAFRRSLSISALMRQLLEEALKLPKEADERHGQN